MIRPWDNYCLLSHALGGVSLAEAHPASWTQMIISEFLMQMQLCQQGYGNYNQLSFKPVAAVCAHTHTYLYTYT